ncbi:MAG TPA: hypothetical protein VL202_23485 [Pararhizobium sp.]|uniref:hypothetical protein n=1 Tax=Pararhizobium sp. TaxID=1977563 RepID=UPI002BFB0E0E|nr:hypothetical protein [Pararhizobium sp.]HTO34109.1 hypothetical protein [Pararhizobium sp.]
MPRVTFTDHRGQSVAVEERDMLEFAAAEITNASRLSCQIKLTVDHDGLCVTTPETRV